MGEAPAKQEPKKPTGQRPMYSQNGFQAGDPRAKNLNPGNPLKGPPKAQEGVKRKHLPGFGKANKPEVATPKKPKQPPSKPKSGGPLGGKLPYPLGQMSGGKMGAKNKWNHGPMAQAMAKAKAQIQQRQGRDGSEI